MRQLTLSVAFALGAAQALSAQAPVTLVPSTPRFGIIFGANLTNGAGDDLAGTDTKSKTGMVGGIMASLPIAPNFAFQPELTLSQKGAKFDEEGTAAKMKLNYVELPLLLRFDVPTAGNVRPFLLAGPAPAFQTSCNFNGAAQGISVTLSCETLANESGESSFKPKKFDVGAMFGGGLTFDVNGRALGLGVRYNVGLMKAFEADVKNRALSFVGTFEFPLLRK